MEDTHTCIQLVVWRQCFNPSIITRPEELHQERINWSTGLTGLQEWKVERWGWQLSCLSVTWRVTDHH